MPSFLGSMSKFASQPASVSSPMRMTSSPSTLLPPCWATSTQPVNILIYYSQRDVLKLYVDHKTLSTNASLGVKVATPVGTLVGQLLFGWLADVLGRKKMYGFELMLIIVTTFAQALSATGPSVDVIGVLVVWRFLMGVGVGGDYPLSAVISSEFASTRSRGRLMTAVFAFQGWGQLGKLTCYLLGLFSESNALYNR